MEESSSSSSTLSPSSSSFDSLSTSDLESPSTVLFPKYPSFSHRGKPPMVVGPRFFFSSSSDEGAHHHFLDSCHLCKKPIGGGRDIFMYRGDTPFCSEECRQEQIEIDEADETREKMSKKQSKSPTSPTKSEKLHARVSGTVIAN